MLAILEDSDRVNDAQTMVEVSTWDIVAHTLCWVGQWTGQQRERCIYAWVTHTSVIPNRLLRHVVFTKVGEDVIADGKVYRLKILRVATLSLMAATGERTRAGVRIGLEKSTTAGGLRGVVEWYCKADY